MDVEAFATSALTTLTGWIEPYLWTAATAWIATALVVFGNDLNAAFGRLVHTWPFIVRVTAFTVFCAVLLGLILEFLTPALVSLFQAPGRVWTGLAVVGAFFALGLIAEKRGYGR